jgi:hypothetical protein
MVLSINRLQQIAAAPSGGAAKTPNKSSTAACRDNAAIKGRGRCIAMLATSFHMGGHNPTRIS